MVKKRLSVPISPSLHQALKLAAAREQRSIADIVIAAITPYISAGLPLDIPAHTLTPKRASALKVS